MCILAYTEECTYPQCQSYGTDYCFLKFKNDDESYEYYSKIKEQKYENEKTP